MPKTTNTIPPIPAIRLNYASRRELAIALVKPRFQLRKDEAKAARAKLADKAYDRVYHKYAKAISALPAGALLVSGSFVVSLAGMKHRLYFSEVKAVFGKHDPMEEAMTLLATDQLCIDLESALAEERDAELAEKDAYRQVIVALNKFATTKLLVKGWPEVEPLVRALFSSEAVETTLPAVVVADLNKLVGLPRDAEK